MNMLTKTTLAAVMLAAMAVSAQAQQQGKTRQIQVLAAPGAQVAAAPAADQAPVDAKPEIAQANPAPAPDVAPKAELAPPPAPEPKVLVQKVEPKFVAPIIEKPARKAYGYSGYGYRAPHCH